MYSEVKNLSQEDLLAFDPRHLLRDGERDCCCPLCGHEKSVDASHRSLSYNTHSGLWRCARCGGRGLLREWQKNRESESDMSLLNRARSRQSLRKRMAIETPVSAPVHTVEKENNWRDHLRDLLPLNGGLGEIYLQKARHLPSLLCHIAGVRFAPRFFGRPAVLFPIRDGEGSLVAAQGRYIDGRDNPRMRTVGERKRGMFLASQGLWTENKTPETVAVTEAPIDALTLTFAGMPQAVALCGCEGIPEWFRVRCAFKTVYAAFDADDAGEKASIVLATSLRPLGATVLRLRPEGAKDWNALLVQNGWEKMFRGLLEATSIEPCYDSIFLDELCEAAVCYSNPDESERIADAFSQNSLVNCETLARHILSIRETEVRRL